MTNLVTDESKSFALSGGHVPDQVDVHNLAVLTEHADDVALWKKKGFHLVPTKT